MSLLPLRFFPPSARQVGEGLYNGGPPGHPYCNRGAAGLGCSTITNSVIRDNGMGINNNGDLTIADSLVVYNRNTARAHDLPSLPAPPPAGRSSRRRRTSHPALLRALTRRPATLGRSLRAES